MIIAQLSDPHIRVEPGGSARAERAAARLQQAVAHLLALSPLPDVVLVSGDCADTGHPDEYARFQELLRPLPMPVFVIPGNHDDRDQMLQVFGPQGTHQLPGFMQYVVDDWPVRLIALDTNVPGQGVGALDAARLQWLEQRLAEAPERLTMIVMHHPPLRTGLTVMDEIGLPQAEALAAIVARHQQVERIVAGHVHMALLRRFAGTLVMTCPSTAHTLLPDLARPEQLTVLLEPPACLLHVWQEATGLLSCTSLIGDHGPPVQLHDGVRWRA